MSNISNGDWSKVIETVYEGVKSNDSKDNGFITTLAKTLGVKALYENWLSTNAGSTLYEKVDSVLTIWKNQECNAVGERNTLIKHLAEKQKAKSCQDLIYRLNLGAVPSNRETQVHSHRTTSCSSVLDPLSFDQSDAGNRSPMQIYSNYRQISCLSNATTTSNSVFSEECSDFENEGQHDVLRQLSSQQGFSNGSLDQRDIRSKLYRTPNELLKKSQSLSSTSIISNNSPSHLSFLPQSHSSPNIETRYHTEPQIKQSYARNEFERFSRDREDTKTMIVIGRSRSGKSSLCNFLSGEDGYCNNFQAGSDSISTTQKTTVYNKLYRGTPGRHIRMIDTKGFSLSDDFDNDIPDEDFHILADLMTTLSEIDCIHLFVICMNGNDLRLPCSLVKVLNIFKKIYGHRMEKGKLISDPLVFWQRCIINFTHIEMNESKEKFWRKKHGDPKNGINNLFEGHFGPEARNLECVYIDSQYDKVNSKIMNQETESLYRKLLSMDPTATRAIKELNRQRSEDQLRIQRLKRRSICLESQLQEMHESASVSSYGSDCNLGTISTHSDSSMIENFRRSMINDPGVQIRELTQVENMISDTPMRDMERNLPTFLYCLRDKMRKLIFPSIFIHGLKNCPDINNNDNDIILSFIKALNSSIDIGVKIFEYDSHDLANKNTETYSVEQRNNDNARLEQFCMDVLISLRFLEKLTEFDSSSYTTVKDFSTSIKNKAKNIANSICNKSDCEAYIDAAFALLANQSDHKSIKDCLKHLDLEEINSINNNYSPEAFKTILRAFEESGLDNAVLEQQRLIVTRSKLEAMIQLKCFFHDSLKGRSDNVRKYSSSNGIHFLRYLEDNWNMMKTKIFVREDNWNVPAILIIGPPGSGKSSLCNVISGKLAKSTLMCDGFLNCEGESLSSSEILAGDYCYNGDIFRPVTIIDTPSFDGERTGNISDVISQIVNLLSSTNGVNQIIITISGMNPRIDSSVSRIIDTVTEIFGPSIWRNVAIVFTKISMDKKRIKNRKSNWKETSEEYVNHIKNMLVVKENIDLEAFFIDALYNEEDEDEKNYFDMEIDRLWNSISKKQKHSEFSVKLSDNVIED